MLIIECNKIKKYAADRILLDIPSLKIYSEDRIGLVGRNGAGKTTLIHILAGITETDEGIICLHGRVDVVSQLSPPTVTALPKFSARKYNTGVLWQEYMSGGEKARFKMAEAFEKQGEFLLADEPSSNLDFNGLALLSENLKRHRGGFLLISHDRNLLDETCNKIWELSEGSLKVYDGNYSDYKRQREAEHARKSFEYEQYLDEKNRLTSSMCQLQAKSRGMNKTPKRMGNSEARLHRLGNQKAEASVDNRAKILRSRLQKLKCKEKPKEELKLQFCIPDASLLHKKILVSGRDLTCMFGSRTLFQDSRFDLPNGSKTALLGANGSGKTTLLSMIMNRSQGIAAAAGLRIGYFSQDLDILDLNKTLLQNVMPQSSYDEYSARALLSQLLFKGSDVQKSVSVLSGGERVKAALAKTLLADHNILILDEPTNYLDIPSIEALEAALAAYDRTLLFVSHDLQLVRHIADHILAIQDRRILSVSGGYDRYISSTKAKAADTKLEDQLALLQNKRSELISRLSLTKDMELKARLELEYEEVMQKLKTF